MHFGRRRARTFLNCGIVFGIALDTFMGLYWFHEPGTGAVGVFGAVLPGWASYRWGDAAWELLGRNLWWFS